MLKTTEIKRLTRKATLLLPLFMAVLVLSLSSCSESDNTVEEYPDWQNTNATYWDKLYTTTQSKVNSGDTTWKIIKNFSVEDTLASPNTDYIIVNVQTTGKGSGCPLYTDSVRVRYTGQLLPSTSYPNGYVFDTTNGYGTEGSSSIPGYSVLKFRIQLIAYARAGASLPKWK